MMTVEQNFSLSDLVGLSESEKQQLFLVMKKAKEFEYKEDLDYKMRQPLAGVLSKYTNVVKGWQYRWFVLNPQLGTLDYYEKEEHKQQKPRGTLHLAGAQISPSDEDEQTFSINAANGELYRLRGLDAKERQHWVMRLRATAEHHTDLLLQSQAQAPWERTQTPQGSIDSLSKSHESLRRTGSGKNSRQNPAISSPIPTTSVPRRSPVIVTRRCQHKTVVPTVVSYTQPGAQVPSLADAQFRDAREMLTQVAHQHATLNYRIQDLPGTPAQIDRDLLLLKATSAATLSCLDQCLSFLQQHAINQPAFGSAQYSLPVSGQSVSPAESFLSVASHVPTGSSETRVDAPASPGIGAAPAGAGWPAGEIALPIRHDEEVEDEASYEDTELAGVEEHKPIILHLLSQLKLGMDLTKVVLPTFILEKRSLLEMFADCMAHPHLFLSIPDHATPAARMQAVLTWYLTSFHAGRKECQAKKPYNPIIGEHFHCSWKLAKNQTKCSCSVLIQQSSTPTVPPSSACPNATCNKDTGAPSDGRTQHPGYSEKAKQSENRNIGGEEARDGVKDNGTDGDLEELLNDADSVELGEDAASKRVVDECGEDIGLYYCAEQVSHHPPISAVYFESPEKQMYMQASIYTKSKFLGMSIGVMMVGKVSYHLLGHGDETYEFSLPSAYARSILTVPWVELGDRINVTSSTGHSASVIFHTKPFYGGKLHRVTCEMKNPAGDITWRANGEWNQGFTVTGAQGTSEEIRVDDLAVQRKRVRPLTSQSELESRRLWKNVTNAIQKQDLNQATEQKRFLEERQRQGEKHRKETNTPFPTQYFKQDGDNWVFNNCLKPGQKQPSI